MYNFIKITMKKIVFFIVFVCLAIASSLSTNAQVDYSVSFYWDDSNCDCNTPVTVYAKVTIRTYPGGALVDDTDWYQITTPFATIDDEASSLQDCEEVCYNVAVIIKVEDNTGQCCYGSDNENKTGQDIKAGFTMSNTIVLY